MIENPQERSCILCGEKCSELYELHDDRYGYPGSFQLLNCRSCGHKFLEIALTGEQLTDMYKNYYPRSSFKLDDYSPHREVRGFKAWLDGSFRSAFRWVPRNVRVLDVGCGFGETLGYHKARGCDVYGVEADENIQRVVAEYGYTVHIGLFDPDMYEEGYFDCVTMDQAIEHVADPVATLRGIARILKRGGIAVLSTPNANGWGAKLFKKRWINWHAPYHLHHFSRSSMKIAAEQVGLVVEKAATITSSEWLHYQWMHLLTYPDMGEPSPFWSPKAGRSPGQQFGLRMLGLFHETRINHMITRLFDALGTGDNFLFVLRRAR
ncbi:MAG: class I SAM-dependent methyltransferase [Nitrospirae bacterium]|nr:class I SAM-dependent methyltransferase [Nitrospirota bacterium]